MTAHFITFEGLDGSGKSTHLKRLAARLTAAGVAHQVTHEPGGTPLGEAVREVFLDPRWDEVDGTVELLLVFASRRQHLIERIEPALEAGEHVLCDRFTDSTRAYQGAGRGVDAELIDRLDALATDSRTPDRTLLFDLPAATARRRRSKDEAEAIDADRLDREVVAFYERVRQGYLALARADPERFRYVDSSGTHEETERQVCAALADLFPALTAGAAGTAGTAGAAGAAGVELGE